jgi:hypothetical protein
MALVDVLTRCRELTLSSDDTIYSSAAVSEIVDILSRCIESLERGTEFDRKKLELLFAPTGAL